MKLFGIDYEGDVDLQELEAAKTRLIQVAPFTRHPFDKDSRDERGRRYYERSERGNRQYNIDHAKLEENYLNKVYVRDDGQPSTIGYYADIKLIQKFIGKHALLEKDRIFEKRVKLVEKINRKYLSPGNQASLIKHISILLCYRCGLPYMQTYETRDYIFPEIDDEVPPGFLEKSETPNTLEELYPYHAAQLMGPTLVITLLANAHKPAIAGWHQWSESVGEADPYDSPYVERFRMLKSAHPDYPMETLRSITYKLHPICMVLHRVISPYALADIVRQADLAVREEKLKGLLKLITNEIEISSSQIKTDFTLGYSSALGYSYNWGSYRPLLIHSSYKVHKGNSKALKFLCDNIILPNMYAESPRAMLDDALFYGSILLALASFGTTGAASAAFRYTIQELGQISLTFAVADIVKAYITEPEKQVREDLLRQLDSDIVAYENNTSPSTAVFVFLLELFTELPESMSAGSATKAAVSDVAENVVDPSLVKTVSDRASIDILTIPKSEIPPVIERLPRVAPGHLEVPRFPTTGGAAIEMPPGSSRAASVEIPQAKLSPRATEGGVPAKPAIEDPLVSATLETRATLPEQKGLSSTPIAQTIAAVPDSGILAPRYSINSLSDIKKLREGLPATPANLDAANQKLWNEYLSYYEKRLNKIEAELTQGSISSNPPRTWESYQSVRQSGSSAAMARGMEHQKRVDTSMTADYPDNKNDPTIRIEEEFLTEGDVGMSKKPDPTIGEVKFADQTIVDRLTGEVTTVSNKSRHFEQILQDPLDARQWSKIKEIVRKDVQELYDKYAGDIYIRRPKHPFYNQKKTVTEIILVYDGDPSLINRELSEYITREADKMISKLNKGNDAIAVDLIVTFQYK